MTRAGIPAYKFPLENVPRLISAYYEEHPDKSCAQQRISFGTSGHRGSSKFASYTQDHVAAITQAIVLMRKQWNIHGPLFIGMDTHALSEPALRTALEVLCANQIETVCAKDFAYTPTPVISHAIMSYNREHKDPADGIIITPSHNQPYYGGFKYNPPTGGPATPEWTKPVEDLANQLLFKDPGTIKRLDFKAALNSSYLHFTDFKQIYLNELAKVINLKVIAESKLKLAVNPQGGASLAYWQDLAQQYQLNLEIINTKIDPTFAFMPYDHDDEIRMDCMSPYTMQPLIAVKDQYDLGIANDPDADRHGIVTPRGLMNSNHYLCSVLHYLLHQRPHWPEGAVGKTIGASMLMDKIIKNAGFKVFETPIGFKWFAKGLAQEQLVFGCEESAGASFLDFKGHAFSTDKDGFLAGLIGAELCAVSGLSLDEYYAQLTQRFGDPIYGRIDEPIAAEAKAAFAGLTADKVKASDLAGDPIVQVITRAPGNQAPIGGIKVIAQNSWFAARPSGTENIYKIYYESFLGSDHAAQVRAAAVNLVLKALSSH